MTQFTTTLTSFDIASAIQVTAAPDVTRQPPALTQTHHDFLADIKPGLFKQICQCFPTEDDTDRLVAVACILSFSCQYDDHLETLDFDSKQILINQTLNLCDNQNVEVDHPALVLAKTTLHKIMILTRFRYNDVLAHFRRMIVGFRDESQFQYDDSHDTELYQRIRFITIGVLPLFAILAAGRVQEKSTDLIELEHAVIAMCGLQNDLLGLHRDIQAGEMMSFPVVHGKSRNSCNLNDSVQTGIEVHNNLGRDALRCYRSIRDDKNAATLAFAEKAFFLPALSFKYWARCARYQVKQTVTSQSTSNGIVVDELPVLGKAAVSA